MLINFDTSRLYFHSELPWSANHPGGPTGGGEAVVKWLEAMARTPQEKAEVAQEFAQDQTDPTHMLGNGINENSLYGWALMGVDPFDPYGPDGGLQGVINQLKTGSTGSVATKDAEKQAKKAEQKSGCVSFLGVKRGGRNMVLFKDTIPNKRSYAHEKYTAVPTGISKAKGGKQSPDHAGSPPSAKMGC